MHPKTFSKITQSPLHIFIIIILTIISTKTHSLDQKFEACAPKSCGNLSSIRYPFWVADKQEPYCGHPSLKITCKNDENPILEISSNGYIITHVDYSNHTFHLADSLLFDDNITCPTPPHNITLNQTLLNFAYDYAEFFLFYNCSSLPKDFKLIYPISCDDDDDSEYKSFGDFHAEFVEEFNYSISLCQSVVVAPVEVDEGLNYGYGGSTSSSTSSLWKMNYKEILRLGFALNWTVHDHDCGACETSGGRCGFDDDKFVCLCRDKPHSESCHLGKETSKSIIIGVGVAAAGGILLACISCFLYAHRHKWLQHRSLPAYIAQKKPTNGSYSSTTSDIKSVTGSTYFGVQMFSYRELEEATDFFNPNNELGSGGFGTVYYAKLGDGREVAIKRLYENNNKRAQQFMNEVEILAHLRHNNLVTLYGCTSRQSREQLLVYDYIPNGTVADHLHGQKAKPGSLSWPTRLNIAVETASALLYLHSSDIIHRDIKTQNILLDKDFSVKVADFGLSRLFPLDVTHVSTAPQGTPGYVDPEYHQCYQLTEKSDVYSFGVLLAELISSKPAVDITRQRQEINLSNMAINKIQNNALHEFVDPSLGFESDLKVKKEITAVAALAFQCLQGTREMRPSMEEVLEILTRIQDDQNKVDKAEVVDIPDDDMYMLKSDLSPGSTQTDDINSTRRCTPHASV